jgi:DNA (cytosine-5)-methyltransferase 1
MLNGLDLFSGIGGLTLALSPWIRPVAYCERDRYCQAVLLSRMERYELPPAPIWDDVCTLRWPMLKKVDAVYGGFPCQDISLAGLGKGLAGERSGLAFEVFRLVDEFKPTFIFLENVPGIRTRGGETVGKELASRGYDCRWLIVSAAEVGAPHLRKRWFLLAHSKNDRIGWGIEQPPSREMANPNRQRGRKRRKESEIRGWNADTLGESWWDVEPNVGRVANGIPARVDRIRGLGNAVVPLQAREAFKRLMGL